MRYATRKDVQKLETAITELSKRVLEMAQSTTYRTLEQNPYVIPEAMRKEIIEKSEGMLCYLYKELFRTHPPISKLA